MLTMYSTTDAYHNLTEIHTMDKKDNIKDSVREREREREMMVGIIWNDVLSLESCHL